MPSPLHVPRVNNNDDSVRIVDLGVKEGDFVSCGQIIGAVETDKAVLDVSAERDGYVLKILHRTGETASVGSVLLWLGEIASERVPEEAAPAAASEATGATRRPTAKAQAMLRELGLSADVIPLTGERLTVVDIEAWLAAQRTPARPPGPLTPPASEPTPGVSGECVELSGEERGMLSTVLWHRDQAVPAYLDVEYDPKPWNDYALGYAEQNKLLMSPLLALLAFRLVELAKATPRLNATVIDDRRYQYQPVNLGFTVQAGQTLYLAVVQDAQAMSALRFIDGLGEVQRHAMAHKLRIVGSHSGVLQHGAVERRSPHSHPAALHQPDRRPRCVAHLGDRGAGRDL